MNKNIFGSLFILFILSTTLSCKKRNHIEKYQVNIDSLKALNDGSYGYHRGRTYYINKNFRIWFNFDEKNNIANIFKIDTLSKKTTDKKQKLEEKIDTVERKIQMQKFLDLSRKYKFGHINIDKSNKISFTYNEDISEEYVWTFNDSLKQIYQKNNDFKLLKDGWFEYNRK